MKSSHLLASAGLIALVFSACQQDPISSTGQSETQSTKGNRSVLTVANPAIAYVQTVAATKHTPATLDLKVMDADGGNRTTVYSLQTTNSLDIKSARWNAAGSTISYNGVHVVNSAGWRVVKAVDVSVVNGVPTGSNARTLVDSSSVSKTIECSVWSPSTSSPEIAYTVRSGGAGVNQATTSTSIYAQPASGGTSTLVYTTRAGVWTGYLSYSPDGSKIAFIAYDYGNEARGNWITIVSRSTGALLDTIPLYNNGRSYGIWNLDWSRTGTNLLAFNAVLDSLGIIPSGSVNSIYTMSPSAGSTPTLITAGIYPTWSSDNSKLAFRGSGVQAITLSSGSVQTLDATGCTSAAGPNWKR